VNSHIARNEPATVPPLAAAAPGVPLRAAENPLLLIRRYLRERYPLAIALGLILSIPCALVGYFAVPPMYTSTGIVRVSRPCPRRFTRLMRIS
jgi:hypothetical protein